MVLYVFSIGFKFAKNNKGGITSLKVMAVLSLFAVGGVVLAALFIRVNAELRRSQICRFTKAPVVIILADFLSYRYLKLALLRLELIHLRISSCNWSNFSKMRSDLHATVGPDDIRDLNVSKASHKVEELNSAERIKEKCMQISGEIERINGRWG